MSIWQSKLETLDIYRARTKKLDRAISKEFKGKMVRIIKNPKLFSWEGHIKKNEIKGRIVEISDFTSNYGQNIFHGNIMRRDMADSLCVGRIALSYDEFQLMEIPID